MSDEPNLIQRQPGWLHWTLRVVSFAAGLMLPWVMLIGWFWFASIVDDLGLSSSPLVSIIYFSVDYSTLCIAPGILAALTGTLAAFLMQKRKNSAFAAGLFASVFTLMLVAIILAQAVEPGHQLGQGE